MKTESTGKALVVAKTYVKAITDKDLEKILSVSADNVVCNSPLGEIQGLAAFKKFHGGFAQMLKKVTTLAIFGDDEHAVIVYKADTHPVPNSIVAEHIVIENGKIASTRVIYDATPFAAFVASLPKH